MSTEITDAGQRKQALDIRRSFIVQAPAGSGKTSLLTQRFLALLSHAETPEEILAITFTRKAAGEMRNRIVEALVSANGEAPEAEYERSLWKLGRRVLERDRNREWNLRENPNRLRVQTIDSFCASLSRRMPVLSSFGGQPQANDDSSHLYQAAARQTVLQLENDDWKAPLGTLLSDLDNNIGQLERLIADMLQRRDQWLRRLFHLEHEDLRAELEETLQTLVRLELEQLEELLSPVLLQRMVTLARFAAAHLPENQQAAPVSIWLERDNLPTTDPADLDAWQAIANMLLISSKSQTRAKVDKRDGFPTSHKEEKSEMVALLEELANNEALIERLHTIRNLPVPHYSDAQWLRLESLVQVLIHAVQQLQLVFAERGEVDHVEVMLRALQALGDEEAPTDLALMLDYSIRHLLVDEFQDTSHGQYELLRKLTAGWEPDDGRTLFCVGDPMQSIYRFREADVGLYLQARQNGIGHIHPESLTLCRNFRSNATIINWVNDTFEQTFPDDEQPVFGAVTYAASEAHHPVGPTDMVRVHASIDDDRQAEAEEICRIVQQTREANPDETIAILVRAKSHLADILPTLRNAGIHFQALDIETLGHHQVVRDLTSLTRALLHPGDRIAWLSLLRAPWCGLNNGDLLALTNTAGEKPLRSIFMSPDPVPGLSEDGQQRIEAIASILANRLAEARRQPLRKLVESTWLALGGPALVEEPAALEAAERFFDILGEQEKGGDLESFTALEDALENLYAPPDPLADGKIQVMTMHKSKGLEFDTVILPGLGRKPNNDNEKLLNWSGFPDEDGEEQLVMAPISETAEKNEKLTQYIRHLEKQKQEYEDIRLLYVATTRARKRLHLFGSANLNTKSDEITPVHRSLLHRLWKSLSQQFDELADSVPENPKPKTTPDPVRLKRIVTGWLPAQPVAMGWPSAASSHERERKPEFLWAGTTARHIGTLVHRYLEKIGNDGLADWDPARVLQNRTNISNALASLGLLADELPDAVDKVVNGILNTLEDTRGRWILERHATTRCEYPLTIRTAHGLQNIVIDRTFVDENDHRWIIDYKTGSHEGGSMELFMDQEEERYREQLLTYRDAFDSIEDRTIHIALFFPMLKAWREIVNE